MLITDAAVNIAPDLATKVDIVQNAVDLFAIGARPRASHASPILAAVETVNPANADHAGSGGLVQDGRPWPDQGCRRSTCRLALDNAISLEAAARIKGIVSPVAGRANILLVPDLEAGNMLAKNLSFMANADAAGDRAGRQGARSS